MQQDKHVLLIDAGHLLNGAPAKSKFDYNKWQVLITQIEKQVGIKEFSNKMMFNSVRDIPNAFASKFHTNAKHADIDVRLSGLKQTSSL